MPEVTVQSTRPGKFSSRGIVQADGSINLFVTPASTARGGTFLYGDFRVGDEIVRVDGVDISSLGRGEAQASLRAGAMVTVKRRVAAGKYDLIELECRRAEPPKEKPKSQRQAVP